MFRTVSTAVSIATILLLNGCTESPKPAEAKTELPKKPAVPTGPIPALAAYYEVYRVARQIAPDIQTASITGEEVGDVKCSEGKYPEWKIVFVSPSKGQATTFIYTTVEHDNLLRGMNNTGSIRWAGPTRTAMPFSNSEFSIDSDAAYKAAAEKAAAWLKKNPTKPVATFALGHAAQFPAPMWYILWGDKKTGGYEVYVNADTGRVLGKG